MIRDSCWFIFALLLFAEVQFSLQSKKHCDKLRDDVSEAHRQFTHCAISNAVPVHFCLNCLIQYQDVSKAYSNLTNGKVTDDKNVTIYCKDLFFDNDRLNIVATIQESVNDLWGKANCAECYNGEEARESNDTIRFRELEDNFGKCMIDSANNKENPCVSCGVHYTKLNSFYNELTTKHKGKTCFDLQDQMNRTRSLWSKDKGCCQRQANFLPFTLVVIVMTSLPLLFYGGLFVHTKRNERNHEMLISEPDPENEQRPNGGDNIRAIPSTSSAMSSDFSRRNTQTVEDWERDQKKVFSDESDESGDDDLLIDPKPQTPQSSTLIQL